jgi:dTMP kinase
MLVTIEGPEGSGKSTQARAIYRHMTGIPGFPEVVLTREPGGTALGQGIRELLLHGPAMHPNAELLLYAADRAQHVEQVIRPALEKGQVVLCDRYIDSTVAYQGYGRGLDIGRIWAMQEAATGGLMPDLTLYLRLPVELGLARVQGRGTGEDRIESARLEFHRQVAKGYEAIAEADPARIVPVPAGMPVGMVTRFCIDVIKGKYGALF